MDSEEDWAALALFSPSKARIQQAQAKDWSFVEAWLIRQYGKRLPAFERNEATLQALLNLASQSEAADESRLAFDRVEKSALRAYQSPSSGHRIDVLKTILNCLDREGQQYSNAMAEACVDIDAYSSGSLDIAMCLTDMTSREFDLQQQMKAVERQRAALIQEQKRLTCILSEMRDDSLQPEDGLAESAAEWQRNSRHLKAKLGEYNERIAASQSSTPREPSVEDLLRLCTEVEQYQNQLDDLNGQAEAYQNLPSNRRNAQKIIDAARDDLRTLVVRRDRLFEDLATNP